ncbi:Ig-like domain-containing protein [Schumannella luteola]|uniref:Fibronectin type-III domain-containing protein n=1 Tax=Schumannella luteola TaxID=472059 RepID=A0A852YGE6_9MICO|nr:hypothetical protein [Schumannella luteola]TPX06268.1 tandem-95 repeat protein [Schumannella luteola]
MGALSRLAARPKALASGAAIAVVGGALLALAVAHPGYPLSDVDLTTKDVWVTNSEKALGGRLNRQIDELTGAVNAASGDLDVLQDGETAFIHDRSGGTLSKVDPAYLEFGDEVTVPKGAQVSYGTNVLGILRPDDGALWTVGTQANLSFDAAKDRPLLKLGQGAAAVVAENGTVFAVSPVKGLLYTVTPGSAPVSTKIPKLGGDAEVQISAVGDVPVVLDAGGKRVIRADGSSVKLSGTPLKLQQASAEADAALVATSDRLLSVPLDGDAKPTTIGTPRSTATTDANRIAAPVRLAGCVHGAWARAGSYLLACDGQAAQDFDIPDASRSAQLVFRVNRDVIVLNDTNSGDVWVPKQTLRLVDNWDEVTPPDDTDAPEGDEKSATQSFEDTLAERTDVNRPPIARDDAFGVRPGSTTILPVLDNDTDPDGDVLTITNVTDGWAALGTLDEIDGSRALQFTPNEGASGAFSFRYTVDDGRPGGVAQANVQVQIVPPEVNNPPVAQRQASVAVEQGQSIGYNVLADWIDPDGDGLFLDNAQARGGDAVRFSADGTVTFRNTSQQAGEKQVDFTVSDGAATASGTLTIDVKPAGQLKPVGTPDFYQTFVGERSSFAPLENDSSPSGAPLKLVSIEPLTDGIQAGANTDLGTIDVTSPGPGAYYLQYTLAAGPVTSIGLIRVDVREAPEKPLPPIAVKDTVYLRGAETGTLKPLNNDVSPSGRVIGVQSVEIPDDQSFLSVEIVSNTELRVTSSQVLKTPAEFRYTISDGLGSSTATVAVLPVQPLVNHQAPIAVDDQATVRAGDVASVDVLANDSHPDGVPLRLRPDLVEPPTEGLAFVSGGRVRFQAPDAPGTYSVVYTVGDDYGQEATARVTFTVTADSAKGDRAPVPQPIVARVFAGSDVTIQVPLDGIDPDGDSTQLVGFPVAPANGLIKHDASAFTYTAFPDKPGTDFFTYEVVDSYGVSATGTIKIGVLPRPTQAMQPVAVNDETAMRPGRTATVPVLANDSDPNGYTLTVSDKLTVPAGVEAEVVSGQVQVTAPEKEQAFVVGYTIINGHGGVDTATLAVTVTKDAPLQPPTAVDHVIDQKDLGDDGTLVVDARAGATNPGGALKDLAVAATGPNRAAATVLDDGTVRVKAGAKRTAIAYTLTNAIDDLTATAFLIVPPAPKAGFDLPCKIRPDLAKQIVRVDETKTYKVTDLVVCPSGRDPVLTGAKNVSATRSSGASPYVDAATLRFTPEKGYRGPATLSFEVTDGASAADPKGNTTTLSLSITVGDPGFKDKAPTFSSPSLRVEAGTTLDFDLHTATAHENPQVVQDTTFTDLAGGTAQVQPSLGGSVLQLTAPRKAKIGSIARITFTLVYDDFRVKGSVLATVVSSTLPLPRTIDDHDFVARGKSATIAVTSNDTNPFADEPLTVVDAKLENPNSGARVTHTASTVTITAGASFIGDAVVVYTVQDATDDSTRQVTGRATATIWDRPEAPARPTATADDGSATVVHQGSLQTNGTAITGYTVRSSAGQSRDCAAGAQCVFTGLQNGTSYSFTVVAHAVVPGSSIATDSSASTASVGVTPYGVPAVPTGVTMSNSGYAPSTVSIKWGASSSSGGGTVRYEWQINGSGGTTGGTSGSRGGQGAGSYSGQVRACNTGDKCSDWAASGAPTVVQNEPPPPPLPNATTRTTCGIHVANFNAYNNDCVSIAAGTRIQFQCRGQQNGKQYALSTITGYGEQLMILQDDTDYPAAYRSGHNC